MFFKWRFIKAFPKVALVVTVLVVSTALFAWWWFFSTPEKREQAAVAKEIKKEEIQRTAAEVEKRLGRLLMIDNELYDLDTGEQFFKKWLKEGVPLNLFVEADGKNLLAQYPNGFVRYGMDGAEKGRLLHRFRLPFDEEYKSAVFCKDKDIWTAGIDWPSLKFVNERKVTSIGQFFDQFFAENLIFGTDKTLVVRVGGKLARVNLDNGEVKPVRFPLVDLDKRRSPNSEYVVGLDGGKFYCIDIDSDEGKTVELGRGNIKDYQWIGNDRCVFVSANNKVYHYNRPQHELTEIVTLPVAGDKIAQPSPTGRYILTGSRQGLCVVDIEGKEAFKIGGGEGTGWVSDDTMIFTRETMDSTLRGTWMQKVGGVETRIFEEPYLAGRGGAAVLLMKEAGVVVFVTKDAVMRMNPDGSDIREIKKLSSANGRTVQVPSRLVGIVQWPGQ